MTSLVVLTAGALEVAQSSPYPISSAGDGYMFAASLFALVCITFLLLMRAIATTRQMWIDRKRTDRREVFWFRATILMICVSGLIARAPDAIYKISWGEVTPDTLHTILAVKEWANTVAFLIVVGWVGAYTFFEPVWTLKLSNPINMVWGGNGRQIKRFVAVVFLSGLLSGAIALSKAFA